MSSRPRVVVLRGTAASLWDLRVYEHLAEEYEIVVPVPSHNLYDTSGLGVTQVPVDTAGGRLSRAGRAGPLLVRAVGERYLGLEEVLAGADIVHTAELGTWFSAQAAGLRPRLGYRLAVTVWETLPFVNAYRNLRTRPYRARVLNAADVFLATTRRAATALALEGASPGRIRICPPGVDLDRFVAARTPAASEARGGHLVLSVGRLVWEKGHQDVLRAVALLRHGGRDDVRVMIVGVGPEEKRLRGVIDDLGLSGVAQLRGWVEHDELQRVYAQASCLVLGSMGVWFWEEQFGMVLVEALAGHLPVVASSSGAIPEVLDGNGRLFAPGDWVGLAQTLADGPLAGAGPVRQAPADGYLERFSAAAAARRLADVYRELLG